MRKLFMLYLLPLALCVAVVPALVPAVAVAESEPEHGPGAAGAEAGPADGHDAVDDHAAGDDHATDSADHGGGHAEGVPLNFKTDLAIWSLVVFLVFITVLKTFAWGPLVEGLDKRESDLRKDIAAAEAARVKAERMLAEHAEKLEKVQDEVREILAEARRDADHTKSEIVAEAQKEAEATKDRAVNEIERARDQALKELFDHFANSVTDATEHVLGRSLSGDDHERFIQEALAQVSEN